MEIDKSLLADSVETCSLGVLHLKRYWDKMVLKKSGMPGSDELTKEWNIDNPNLHWDVSLELPIPFGLQGILYLADTATNQGAFTLVPGFQKKIEGWLNSLAPSVNPRTENIHALGATPVAANTGDFIIWHQALPHGSSANTSAKPRFVQYINYAPLDAEVNHLWK